MDVYPALIRRMALIAVAGLGLAGVTVAPSAPADAADSNNAWVGTWSCAQVAPNTTGLSATGFTDQTVREIVHTTVGGSQLRIRLSNVFGTGPLSITGVHIAVRASGAATVPGTDHTVTFGQKTSTTIAAGDRAVSDPVALRVAPQQDLAVSIFFAEASGPATWHPNAHSTNYYSTSGDHSAETAGDAYPHVTTSWFFLDGVDVQNDSVSGAVVTFGPSTTDGDASTQDENVRYPDDLARRFLAEPPGHQMSVLNAGISANQLLADGKNAGPSGVHRFYRDVIEQTGVRAVVIWEGTNDIGSNPSITPDDIINGWKDLINQAHQHGIRVIGATLQPNEGAGYYTEAGNEVRTGVNQWMRTSGAFDGVVDFDRVLQDPADPKRMAPAFDSGDHLHPNDAGYQAIADAINLRLLSGRDKQYDAFSGIASFDQSTITVGSSSSQAILTVRSWSDRPNVVRWALATPDDLALTPSQGIVRLPANGVERIMIQVSAGHDTGWLPVTAKLSQDGESVLGAGFTVGVGVPSLTATQPSAPVTIDGILDAAWANAQPFAVTPNSPTVQQWGHVWSVPPEGGTVRVMWDSTHLYVFAQITDANILVPATTLANGAPWLDDGVAIYASGADWSFKLAATAPVANGSSIVAGAVGTQYSSNSTVTLRPDAAQVGFATTSSGYNMEMAIDLSTLISGYRANPGTALRFTPLVLDRRAVTGDTNDIWGQAMWVGSGDNPAQWGVLELT